MLRFIVPLFAFIFLAAAPTLAADAPEAAFNSGDTAWMMLSTLLVLMMSFPGLALFYGGMVKKDSVLATLMQTLAVVAIVSLVWPLAGYTLAFTEGATPFIGGFDKLFLNGITPASANGTIPETIFITFQMTFAAITCALLFGAIADRIKFSAVCLLTPLWLLCVYAPVAHWVWGPGGFLGGVGLDDYAGFLGFGDALDFAGGTVVHINSGVAGLVAALVVGRGVDFAHRQSTPTNLVLTLIGTGLLWVGWFGFNAGSALAAGASAAQAFLVTNSAAAAGAIGWVAVEWIYKKKPSVTGAASGVIAGLVGITPAAGFVTFGGAIIIGLLAGWLCYVACAYLKHWMKYDDSLDVFGIHGVGGIVGAVLTGVFASTSVSGASGLLEGNTDQLIAQLLSVGVTIAYSAIVTTVLLLVVKHTIGLRVPRDVEDQGLDMALHGASLSGWHKD